MSDGPVKPKTALGVIERKLAGAKARTQEVRRPADAGEWMLAAVSLGAVLHGATWTWEWLIGNREGHAQDGRDGHGV